LFSFMVFFFFSSRRRHTRFSRDWSSDVCSSDLRWFVLRGIGAQASSRHGFLRPLKPSVGALCGPSVAHKIAESRADCWPPGLQRSEERRVGKEGRCWRAADQEKDTEVVVEVLAG